MINLPAPQAGNSGVSYDGRPPCCGNNNCFPVCSIAAKYDAATALPKIEAKSGKSLANAVVYRIETGEKNSIEAVPHRVTSKIFVIACYGIETPELLLLSRDERNPNGVANSSDQVGRKMMDQPKLTAELKLQEPLWTEASGRFRVAAFSIPRRGNSAAPTPERCSAWKLSPAVP
jgi:fructose 5-dehydrogenase large subunit